MRRAGVIAVILAHLAACSSPSQDVYTSGDVGEVIEISEAQVLAVRTVEIKEENSGIGALTGGVAGGLGGFTVSGDLAIAVVALGSLVGAAVGYVAEEIAGQDEGVEYILMLEDGRYVTIVQNQEEDDEQFAVGTWVLLQHGANYSRVIERPQELGPLPDKDWVNPDDVWINPDTLPPDVEGPVPLPPAAIPPQTP